MTLSNHDIIRLVRFVAKINQGMGRGMSFAIKLHLTFRINGKKIDVTGGTR
jgi:hypothetical protein